MEPEELICGIIMLVILILLTVPDILRRRVPFFLTICSFIPAIGLNIYRVVNGEEWISTLVMMLVGAMPGVFLIVIGKLTAKVGMADGLILCGVGMLETAFGAVIVLCIGSFILSLISMVLLALKKVRRDTEIPFIPFMSLGYFAWRVICVVKV